MGFRRAGSSRGAGNLPGGHRSLPPEVLSASEPGIDGEFRNVGIDQNPEDMVADALSALFGR